MVRPHTLRVPSGDEDVALRWYVVDVPASGSGPRTVTSYHAALRDARRATGRDEEGRVVHPSIAGSWLGAIGYLIFLDQVGTALRRRGGRHDPTPNTIEQALRDFAPDPLSRRDRCALYALRCALAHDYSLYNPPPPKRRSRPEKWFHFALDDEPGKPLIRHATRRWNGDLTVNPDEATRTWVNLRALGDLVEGCHQTIQACHHDETLASRLSPEKLAHRFTFTVTPSGA